MVLAEVADHAADRPATLYHHEIRRGRNHLQLAGARLPHELIAIARIALLRLLVAGGIVERRQSTADHEGVQAVLKPVLAHFLRCFFRRHRITQPHSRQPIDLGECPRHNHAAVVHRLLDERGITRRSHREVVICLIDQHIGVAWQFAQKIFNVGARRYARRRIIRIANVNQSGIAAGGLQHGAHVMRIIRC